MPLKIGNRLFAPGVFGTFATVIVMAGLVSLGFWQLRRADEKQALLATLAAGQKTTAVLTEVNAASLPRYQRVTASGRYVSAQQVLLDNMPSGTGKPGYHVLTPFVLDDGAVLLVDRGWVPVGPDRSVLPEVAVEETPRELGGVLDGLPVPGMRMGTPETPATWPKVLNFPERAQLQAVYGERLLEPILLLDGNAADGFERLWAARFGFDPRRHVGYAIQWFGLGLALLAIYLVVNLKRIRPANGIQE